MLLGRGRLAGVCLAVLALGAGPISIPSASAGQAARASVAVSPDSAAGKFVSCIDMRTAGPFPFQAERILLSGARNDAWVPDMSRLCLGSMEGVAYERVADGNGGEFVGWVDTQLELTDIYLQHFTAAGSLADGWPVGGIPVCTAANSQCHLAMCPDGSGGVMLAWQDFRDGTGDIYASRVTADGQLGAGWQPNGNPICTAIGEQGSPTLARSPDGFFVAWEDRRSGRSGIYLLHMGVDGAASSGWQAQGESLTVATPALNPLAVSDSSGHCCLIWRHRSDSGDALLISVLDEGASHAAPSILVSSAQSISTPLAVNLGSHELFIGWTQWEADSAKARVQRIDLASGLQLAWPPGGAMLHAGNLGVHPAALAADGAGGVVGAWEDFDEDADGDIYGQRLLADGSPDTLWPGRGLAICRAEGNQYGPRLVSDGPDGVIATWGDAAVGGNAGYLASRADPEGLRAAVLNSSVNPGHVRIVWQAPRALGGPFDAERRIAGDEWLPLVQLAVDRNRQVVLDDRTPTEGVRYAYRLVFRDSLGTVFLPPVEVSVPVAPAILKLEAVIPQGRAHALTVLFSLPHGPVPELELLDIQGRRIERQRLDGMDPGEHRFALNLPATMASGVYFVRLSQGTTSRVAKTVYVR